MVAQIVLPPPPTCSQFKWLKEPPGDFDPAATWYIDGSVYHGTWAPSTRTGFAIVVTDSFGSLIGYGNGIPPRWIGDSAGAECWAFHMVLKMCPFVPNIVTDCLGILDMLSAGRGVALGACRPLARVWHLI